MPSNDLQIPPQLESVLDELNKQAAERERQQQEFETAMSDPQFREEMDAWMAQANKMQGYRNWAQDIGPFNALATTMQMNVEKRGRGLQESAMMATRGAAPLLQSIGLLRNMYGTKLPLDVVQRGLTEKIEAERREQAANDEIYAALREERPYSTGAANILTFGAELALMPKGIKADPKHPWKTAGKRMAQEGPIGALYGLSVPAMSDEQKMMVIAGGALTGSLTSAAFTGAGRLAAFTPQTKEAIARFMRIEKLLNKSGILTMGEIMSHSGLQKLEAALDNIPFFGLGRTRRLQREAFRDMTETMLERMFPRQVQYLGTKNGQELVEELSQRIYNQFQKNKEIVKFHYDEVAKLLDNVPPGAAPEVRLTQYRTAAKRLLSQEKNRLEEWQNKELIRELEKAISGPEHIRFETARNSLSAIKEAARVEAKKVANAEVTRERRAALGELEFSLIDDMGTFAKSIRGGGPKGQNIMQQYQAANDAYRRLLLPFYKADTIGDLVTGIDATADDIAGAFLSTSAPRGKVRVEPLVSPSGRVRAGPVERTDLFARQGARSGFHPTDVDVARYMIVREALERSSKSADDVMTGRINPQAFAQELESMSDLWGVTFTRPQKELLEGYTDLIRQAHRAFRRESAIGPLVTAGAGGAMLGSAAPSKTEKVWAVMVTLGSARFFLGTKTGNKLTRAVRNAFLEGTDNEIQATLAKAQQGFIRWMAGYYPEMYAEAYPETQGLIEKSPFAGWNPMTQGAMGAEPMFKEEE